MGFLKVNKEEAGSNNFEPIPLGEYEVLITEIEKKQSQNGNDMLKLTLTVRDDVAQPAQKRKVWDYLVATEKAMFKFQQVAVAVGLPEGQDFASITEFAKAIQFKPVKIRIKHEQNEYQGEMRTQERVAYYKEATYDYNGGAPTSDPFATDAPAIDINDDDLPF